MGINKAVETFTLAMARLLLLATLAVTLVTLALAAAAGSTEVTEANESNILPDAFCSLWEDVFQGALSCSCDSPSGIPCIFGIELSKIVCADNCASMNAVE